MTLGTSLYAAPMISELHLMLPLEHPFAWKTESFHTYKGINFVPRGTCLTISFTATRSSKILGYIPIIGTVIGVYRISKGFFEQRLFDNAHLHYLSKRSIKWIIRGSIELLPIIGGIICIIADIIATNLLPKSPNSALLPDSTPCGFCHTCDNYCKC